MTAAPEKEVRRSDGVTSAQAHVVPTELVRPGLTRRMWVGTRPFRPVLFLSIALFIAISFLQSEFLTTQNLQNLLVDVSVLWVVAIGMTFALLTGSADLSAGGIAAVVGIFIAKTVPSGGLPGGVAIVLALVMGGAIGAFTNGILVGWFRLSFFVVTLGTLTAMGGVVTLWSNGASVQINSPAINALAIGHVAGIDAPIVIMVGVFLLALFVQHRTYFGRNVYAVGGSATAARLSGIRTERTLVLVFGVIGVCAALGGVLDVGLAGASNPSVDPSLALEAIAAVLLGGTSLFGGAGSVVGTALGVLFLGLLQNALNLAAVAAAWQSVVTGVILIVAVASVGGTGSSDRLKIGLARLKRPWSTTPGARA